MAAAADAGSASGLQKLLGDKLQTSDGTVDTSKAMEGKKVIGLYFSAHWCPPCKMFTPQLAKWYSKNKEAAGMEMVFVSSDKDAGQFSEYFGEMPWKALPFSDRARKGELSDKFGVQGIPTLVFLDADGNEITRDGRMIVQLDPECKAVDQWKNPKALILSQAGTFVNADDSTVDAKEYLSKSEYVGLFFTASWCGPCQALKPKLKAWLADEGKKADMSMLLVSLDRTEDAHTAYRKEYPFPAVSWASKDAGQMLGQLLEVRGIPSFVILRAADGAVVSSDGIQGFQSRPKAFPWGPEACEGVAQAWSRITDFQYTALLLADKCTDAAAAAAAGEMLREATEPVFDPFGSKAVQACVASSEDPHADRIRMLTKLTGDKDGATSLRLVAIAPREDKCYVLGNKDGTAQFEKAEVEAFVKSLAEGKPNVPGTELADLR